MSRWFRFYDDAINDPKLLKLSDKTYRVWMGMLCLASKHEGKLPPFDDMALLLRMKPEKLQPELEKLIEAGLLDHSDAGIEPHNWNGRQYKSDTSNERVKRHRQRSCNVTVTPPDTEQKQITEQIKPDARDELSKREGNFRQAIVKAFEVANSPNMPDTTRAGLWLSQGYQEDICLALIEEGVRRKPSISSLKYFDTQISDAHKSKAPPRVAIALQPEQVDWDATLATYKKTGHWSRWAGPDPEQPGCKAPKEMLAKYGLVKSELVKSREATAVIPQLRAMQ